MTTTSQQVRSWYVHVNGTMAIHIRNEPGTISSTVPRRRGMAWPQHPAMHVAYSDLGTEERTAELIGDCTSAEELVQKLRSAGYEVSEYQPKEGTP